MNLLYLIIGIIYAYSPVKDYQWDYLKQLHEEGEYEAFNRGVMSLILLAGYYTFLWPVDLLTIYFYLNNEGKKR
jgi:hypothetical protein